MLPHNLRLHIILWILVIFSFAILATYLIFKVSGYQINFKARSIEQTGLVVVNSEPAGAAVFLNDHLEGITPLELNYLRPTIYHLRVSLTGYHQWEKSAEVEAGKFLNEKVILFLQNPEIKEATEEELNKNALLKTPDIPADYLADIPAEATDTSLDSNKEKIIYKKGSEIWLYQITKPAKERNKIIARFLSNIDKIKFYPGGEHILFMRNNELHIIELTGANDTKLFGITTTDFWPSKDSKQIYYKQENHLQKATIR